MYSQGRFPTHCRVMFVFLLHGFLYRTCRNVAGLSSLRASCVNSAKPSPCSSTCSHWCIALLISSSLSWNSSVTRFRSSTFFFSMMAINESHSLLTWASTSQPDFYKFKKCQLYLDRCNRDTPLGWGAPAGASRHLRVESESMKSK